MQFWSALATAAQVTRRPTELDPVGAVPALSGAAASALARGAMVAGLLCASLALAGSSRVVLDVRLALLLVAELALALRTLRMRPDPVWPHPAWVLVGGLGPLVITASVMNDPLIEDALVFNSLVVIERALAMYVADRLLQPIGAAYARLASALGGSAVRFNETGQEEVCPPYRIHVGDELLLLPGDIVCADGVVQSGEVTVTPWHEATGTLRRRQGQPVVAGAEVVAGRAHLRATYTSFDRAWARTTADPRRRIDLHAKVARIGRAVAAFGGLVGMLVIGLAAYASGERTALMAMVAIGTFVVVSNPLVATMPCIHLARGVLLALRHGISYRSALDWDRTADVSTVAFCARTTLLVGEPELADLVALGRLSEEEILALAAGAEASGAHSVASAVERAALQRRIRPDAVRSPSPHPGLGMTAVASSGETLVVGSRALMLKERISVASAEQTIAEIEAHGRQVLLVALSGKLVGVIGLQDGLRPGARAAVQQLLDAQIEPVLLSGDSRETCEAIGRALDIEHLRPEIAPMDRAHEMERLAQGGMIVAALGDPREDASTLGAAQVAVALGSAGLSPGDWGVAVASEDVREGALGVALPKRTRADARMGLTLVLTPGALTALAVTFGLLPPLCVPVAGALGALLAWLHARTNDRLFAQAGPRSSGAEGG